MKNTAKYYPGSPVVQILGKLHGAANGGYIIQPSPARVSLTLDHGDHLQRWRTYHCDTLAALVEDQLVTWTRPAATTGSRSPSPPPAANSGAR